MFKPLLEKEKLTPIIEKSLGAKEKTMVYAKGGNKTTENIDTRKTDRRRFVLSDEEISATGPLGDGHRKAL